MKEIIITAAQDDQRLDRLLERTLPSAGRGFLCRMMRKKNITVNDKRAESAQRVHTGDHVKIWFSEETLEKFGASAAQADAYADLPRYPFVPLDIVYEDEHVMFVNKPAGMLSQKAEKTDVSLCEYLIGYLLREGRIDAQQLVCVRPSVCNRLDRNTSGLVACGISASGLRQLSEAIRDRRVGKFYRCIVLGKLEEPMRLEGYLLKDERSNTVTVSARQSGEARKIITAYRPLQTVCTPEGLTLTDLEVELVTGRTHQIRAHLASIGHPILGDVRYGQRKANRIASERYHITHQMLHAWRMEWPQSEKESALAGLSGRILQAPVPDSWDMLIRPGDGSEEKGF